MLTLPLKIRSVRTGKITIGSHIEREVTTADFGLRVPNVAHGVRNIDKAVTVGAPRVDIRNLNRLLREPQQPAPELTVAQPQPSTK